MAARQAKATKKMNIALDEQITDWLTYESARRGTSVTGLINQLAYESRDNAPEAVKANYEAFLATREQKEQ